MSAAEQAAAWWRELSAMLQEAALSVNWQPGNEDSVVISGLTTIVGTREGNE